MQHFSTSKVDCGSILAHTQNSPKDIKRSLYSIQRVTFCWGTLSTYQFPLCNYRMMTAELSHHCQQVIARCHLAVKGFLFGRKAHCAPAQVMRLFLYMQLQRERANQSITVENFHRPWSVTLSYFQRSRNVQDIFFFLTCIC